LSNQLKSGVLRVIPTEEHEQFTTLARHRTQVTKKLRQTKSHQKYVTVSWNKSSDEFDNSNWTKAFIAWLEDIKFSTSCGDLALQGKNTMFKFIKSEYLEINQMRAYCRKNNKKITIF
jgi:hypothetical protein